MSGNGHCAPSSSAVAAQSGNMRTVALVGPPNAGKSTLFNALTGLRQKVANFPGVTVEPEWATVLSSGISARAATDEGSLR